MLVVLSSVTTQYFIAYNDNANRLLVTTCGTGEHARVSFSKIIGYFSKSQK
jgi:hypothetical protein